MFSADFFICIFVLHIVYGTNKTDWNQVRFYDKVFIDKNSRLYNIIGEDEILVNSFHKRCISENNIYKVTAKSEDGIIEAIEYPGDYFNIGVQWHPEISYEFDENSKKIIDAFIDASRDRLNERDIKTKVV